MKKFRKSNRNYANVFKEILSLTSNCIFVFYSKTHHAFLHNWSAVIRHESNYDMRK